MVDFLILVPLNTIVLLPATSLTVCGTRPSFYVTMMDVSSELLTSKVQGEDHESVDAEHAEDHAQAGEQEALPVRPGLDLTPLSLSLRTKPRLA